MKKIFVLFIILSTVLFYCDANNVFKEKLLIDTLCYAERNNIKLYVEILSQHSTVNKSPAIIFFFGGGWIRGNREQFRPQAEYLATKGIITILADYRTKELCGATPFDCVEDAKSVIRFIKENSEKLNIDTTKIVASGGSAGGHLAAACAYLSQYNHPDDNLLISSRPAALVLFNPVIDNGENGFGSKEIKKEFQSFSPMHNIKNGNALPTLFMLGSNDKLIPIETAEKFKYLTEENGAICVLKIYEGQEHGFFNYNFKNKGNAYYNSTLKETEYFLGKLGFLKK